MFTIRGEQDSSEGNWPDFAISKFSGVQPVLNNEDIASARQGIVYIFSLSLSVRLGSRVDNRKYAAVVPCLR